VSGPVLMSIDTIAIYQRLTLQLGNSDRWCARVTAHKTWRLAPSLGSLRRAVPTGAGSPKAPCSNNGASNRQHDRTSECLRGDIGWHRSDRPSSFSQIPFVMVPYPQRAMVQRQHQSTIWVDRPSPARQLFPPLTQDLSHLIDTLVANEEAFVGHRGISPWRPFQPTASAVEGAGESKTPRLD